MTDLPPLIDMHAHFYGCGLPGFLESRTTRPCVQGAADGTQTMLAMNGAFPFEAAHTDPAAVLAQMDATGIHCRLLTFPGALCLEALPAPEIAPGIRAFNDGLAALVSGSGGRFAGLGGLPLADLPLAAAEMRRLRHDLGLAGAIIPSDWFATIADARALDPVLRAADETGALLMLHPGPMPGRAPEPLAAEFPAFRTSAVALHAHVSQVVLTLLLSDLLDAYPRVRFQVINLGGTVPFIIERMEAIARHRTPDSLFPTQRLRRLWFDSASLGPRALEMGVALYGADRVMLGTDWPIFRADPLAEVFATVRLDAPSRQAVAGGTAAALLEALTLDVPRWG